MKKIVLLLLTVSFLFVNCSSKHTPVDKLEDFAFELKENSAEFSESDWERAIAKYAEIEESLQEYEYTDEELKEIGRLKAQCLKEISKTAAHSLKNKLHNFQMQMEGAAEEFQDWADELQSLFDE